MAAKIIQVVVAKVTLLKRGNKTDLIFLTLDEKTAKEIHGETLEFWHSASLKLEVANGRGERALVALGIDDFETIAC